MCTQRGCQIGDGTPWAYQPRGPQRQPDLSLSTHGRPGLCLAEQGTAESAQNSPTGTNTTCAGRGVASGSRVAEWRGCGGAAGKQSLTGACGNQSTL